MIQGHPKLTLFDRLRMMTSYRYRCNYVSIAHRFVSV